MAKYIGILGSCATGKSTRVNKFVDNLVSTGFGYQVIYYQFEKNGKSYDLECGRFFPEISLFIAGNKTKTGNWVGADGIFGKLGSKDLIIPFIEHIITFADTFLVEGYFAVGGGFLRPEALSSIFDEFNQYYFTYDSLEEYVQRTEDRTGNSWESRGKEPSVSAGWKSNKSFKNGMIKAQTELNESDMRGEIVSLTKDENITYFIERFETGRL